MKSTNASEKTDSKKNKKRKAKLDQESQAIQQNLPEVFTEDRLQNLFKEFPGPREIDKKIKTDTENNLPERKHEVPALIKSLKRLEKIQMTSEAQKIQEIEEEGFENKYSITKIVITNGEKKEISFTLKEMREQSINLKTLNDKLTSNYQSLDKDYKELEQEYIKLLNTKNEIIKSDDFKEGFSTKKLEITEKLAQSSKMTEEQHNLCIKKYKLCKEYKKNLKEDYETLKKLYKEFRDEYKEFERFCKQHQESKEYSTKNFENTLPLEWSYETLCEDYHMYDQNCSKIKAEFSDALKNLNKIYEHVEKCNALTKQCSELLALDPELHNKNSKETESQKRILELEDALKAREKEIKELKVKAEQQKDSFKQFKAERDQEKQQANERVSTAVSEKDAEITKLKIEKVSSNNRVKELKDANETLNNAINRHREREDKKAQKTNEVSSNIERKEIEKLKKDIADLEAKLTSTEKSLKDSFKKEREDFQHKFDVQGKDNTATNAKLKLRDKQIAELNTMYLAVKSFMFRDKVLSGNVDVFDYPGKIYGDTFEQKEKLAKEAKQNLEKIIEKFESKDSDPINSESKVSNFKFEASEESSVSNDKQKYVTKSKESSESKVSRRLKTSTIEGNDGSKNYEYQNKYNDASYKDIKRESDDIDFLGKNEND